MDWFVLGGFGVGWAAETLQAVALVEIMKALKKEFVDKPHIVLETQNLVKKFGGITATDHVNLQLMQGARHALIGPNGAGKTTLINLMTGVLASTSGKVILEGSDISKLEPHERVKKGLVRTFQINQLFDSMTPLETLAMVVSQQSKQGAQSWYPLGQSLPVVERCEELLELFRLTEFHQQKTAQIPYGKRRLLEMAIALACQPRVLLLDEPVAGVPSGEREELLHTVASLPKEVSVLLIEHDMDLVFEFANQITVLVNGAVLTQGNPKEISQDERVRAVYLGHSEALRHD